MKKVKKKYKSKEFIKGGPLVKEGGPSKNLAASWLKYVNGQMVVRYTHFPAPTFFAVTKDRYYLVYIKSASA